ncbi:TonB-dependent siderophore receptor [Bradyrhizobium ontarionense]|uniref:TonB-dependent siderophore receptor n=1 Tax=Bradyrhizobium ontarionense TaxID=2898149 RepID=A0ABY3R6L2_9BRAD|nr:TonB-dependent siderophore receptor [Bradyrhizobium sp. A19]UFZ02652.1 TonB-dependent siderophore receptor [Bradyrhizobium sp. A19]
MTVDAPVARQKLQSQRSAQSTRATQRRTARAPRQNAPSAAPNPTVSDVRPAAVERGNGPVDGYRATRTTSGTKTDTPLKDIPQEIVVVPRQVLDDRNATTAAGALDVVGGVTRGNNFGGLNNYEFNIRGFPTRNAAKNGISAVRRYEPDDAANVERVEVMMGPSGALYGRSDPSGFYNVIIKQPLDRNFTTLTGTVGSYGMRRATIDSNQALSDDKTWLGRINAAFDQRDSFRDFNDSKRVFVAPVVSYSPSADWRVTFEGEYLKDDRPFDRGLVAVNKNVGALPISRFLGEPNDGALRNQYALGSFRVEHDINKDWLVRFATQYKEGSLYGWTAEPVSVNAAGVLTRRNTFRDYSWASSNSQLETVGHFGIGGFKNTLLAGIEYEHYTDLEDFRRSDTAAFPYSINVFNPVYGQAKPPATVKSLFKDRVDTLGLYSSLQTEWTSQLKTLVGVRYDNYDQDARQLITGQRITQNPSPVIPKAGVTYEIVPNFTLFADVAKSFRPNLDSDTGFVGTASGQAFAPETGIGYEAGVKLDLLDNRFSVTAAGFKIVKDNVLTADPANPGFNTTAGQVTSTGFDINVVGNVTRELRLIGGYAYTDARITRDVTLPVGARFPNVPLNSGSMMAVYEWQSGPLAGLGLGGGVSAAGSRAGDATGTFTVPGYVKFDALAYYTLNKTTKISLNVYNIANTVYYDQVRSATNVYPGQPRTVWLTVKSTF